MCDKEIFPESIRAKLYGESVDTGEFLDDSTRLILKGRWHVGRFISSLLRPEERSVIIRRIAERDDLDIRTKAEAIHVTAYPQLSHGVDTEEKSELEQEMGAYKYIAYGRGSFAQSMEEILSIVDEDAMESFIDVGCGIGDKMLLAHSLLGFEKAFGIEINAHTIELGRWHLNPLQGQHIFHWHEDQDSRWEEPGGIAGGAFTFIPGDAFDYNFGLHRFIYSYVPIANADKMRELWQHIINTMPDGGWYVEVSGHHNFFSKLARTDALDDPDRPYRFYRYHVIHKVDGIPRLLNNNAVIDGYIEYL